MTGVGQSGDLPVVEKVILDKGGDAAWSRCETCVTGMTPGYFEPCGDDVSERKAVRHDDNVFDWAIEHFGHRNIDSFGELCLGFRARDSLVVRHPIANSRRRNEALIQPALRASFSDTVGLLPQSWVQERDGVQRCRSGVGSAPRAK